WPHPRIETRTFSTLRANSQTWRTGAEETTFACWGSQKMKKADIQAFLSSTLPKLTSLNFYPPLEFQRVHRVGPKCSDASLRPRPISPAYYATIRPGKYYK
ncbi:hypothetical protein NDU88_005401, partial [Pleurodeles waltl]